MKVVHREWIAGGLLLLSFCAIGRTPVWPAAWSATQTAWCAETGSWEVHNLRLPHALLPDLSMTLVATTATLTPGAEGQWQHVVLNDATYEIADAAAPAGSLLVDRLDIHHADFDLTVHGYLRTAAETGFDSLFLVPSGAEDRYAFSTDRLRIRSKEELILLSGFSMTPRQSVRRFARDLTERSTRMVLNVGKLEINGADVSDMLRRKSFVADSTVFEQVYFSVDTYMDLPKRPGTRMLPHQLLASWAPNLELGVVDIRDSRIEVQFNHQRRRPGFLSFGDLHATVRNLRNSPFPGPLDIVVDTRFLLYDQGLTRIRFRMPCGTPDGRFWVDGYVGPMDFRAVNEVLVTEGNFRVRRGAVDSLLFRIEANDTLATGVAYPYYHNLKVRKLRGFKSDQPRRFFSSIMDLLGVPNHNPEGGKLTIGHIQYPRDPEQSFFAYCWNALRTGVLSVLTPNYLLPDMQESEKIKNY